ncbi:hypothetical protein ROHU_000834 [Labeo rohita]|uniref:Uncharacterized protein n=1 Tax=Labeo rohita TaxID=84645 RepID=A0A498MTR7_LABRO|nr:hypothetical protein ROHU_021659 [Labeo rohita]RXN38746.1 hypothetical protein ROHU_000834 [Labeo rohita]
MVKPVWEMVEHSMPLFGELLAKPRIRKDSEVDHGKRTLDEQHNNLAKVCSQYLYILSINIHRAKREDQRRPYCELGHIVHLWKRPMAKISKVNTHSHLYSGQSCQYIVIYNYH